MAFVFMSPLLVVLLFMAAHAAGHGCTVIGWFSEGMGIQCEVEELREELYWREYEEREPSRIKALTAEKTALERELGKQD